MLSINSELPAGSLILKVLVQPALQTTFSSKEPTFSSLIRTDIRCRASGIYSIKSCELHFKLLSTVNSSWILYVYGITSNWGGRKFQGSFSVQTYRFVGFEELDWEYKNHNVNQFFCHHLGTLFVIVRLLMASFHKWM